MPRINGHVKAVKEFNNWIGHAKIYCDISNGDTWCQTLDISECQNYPRGSIHVLASKGQGSDTTIFDQTSTYYIEDIFYTRCQLSATEGRIGTPEQLRDSMIQVSERSVKTYDLDEFITNIVFAATQSFGHDTVIWVQDENRALGYTKADILIEDDSIGVTIHYLDGIVQGEYLSWEKFFESNPNIAFSFVEHFARRGEFTTWEIFKKRFC